MAGKGVDDGAMRKSKFIPLVLLAISILSLTAAPVHAGEAYFYRGTSGAGRTFYLIERVIRSALPSRASAQRQHAGVQELPFRWGF